MGSSSSPSSTPASGPGPTPSASQPGGQGSFGPVVVVVEENHSYEQVIGNSLMPYFNSLAQQGASATQYYASVHPSLPNYFMLTTGAIQTMDNNWTGQVTGDNLARSFAAAGRTWKSYVEDLPSAGYLGSSQGEYIKHHNPFAYFSDVVNNPSQAANIVPFSQFSNAVASGTLPNFSLLIPNSPDDAHGCLTSSCTDNDLLARSDQWLKTNIGPLLSSAQFQKSGLLLIVFDESNIADIRSGGGRTPWIALGPKAKAGAQSSVTYGHQNTLRTICDQLGVAPCPGAAVSAAGIDDLVQR